MPFVQDELVNWFSYIIDNIIKLLQQEYISFVEFATPLYALFLTCYTLCIVGITVVNHTMKDQQKGHDEICLRLLHLVKFLLHMEIDRSFLLYEQFKLYYRNIKARIYILCRVCHAYLCLLFGKLQQHSTSTLRRVGKCRAESRS